MVKKIVLLLSAIATLTTSTYAQFCGTDEVNRKARELEPKITQYEAQLKAEIDAALRGMNLSQFAKTTNDSGVSAFYDTKTLYVPIVFHIVHDYGAEYVSDNDIFAALKDINEVYSRTNYYDTANIIPTYKGNIPGTQVKYMGNAHIQFKLAQMDPNGNPSKGITRRRSYQTYFASQQAKADQWPPQSYMNIWIIKKWEPSQPSGLLAYALKPGSVNNTEYLYYDGVICIYYGLSDHTLAHELGHTMNLDHTWGGTNDPEVECGDDGIDDTPPTKGHQSWGCVPAAFYDTVCASNYLHVYDSGSVQNLFNIHLNPGQSLTIDYPDTVNSQNIMDYTGCDRMFTYLQTVAIRTALKSTTANRFNLFDSLNLLHTGITDAAGNIKPLTDIAPTADFSFNQITNDPSKREERNFICTNSSLTLTNRSWNDTIATADWTFTDAAGVVNTTSGLNTVSTQFANPGWASISLTATSNAGSNTITKDSVLYIANPIATPAPGYYQEFGANNNDLSQYPIFNVYNNTNKWEIVNNAGYYDQSSICMKAFDTRLFPVGTANVPLPYYNTPIGDIDEFYTPGFDLSSYTNSYCNLSFMLSGASATNLPALMLDTLEISYLSSCSVSQWTKLATLTKLDLQNVGNYSNGPFVPTSGNDWVAKSFNIPASARQGKVYFRFRYKSSGDRGGGNVNNVPTYPGTGNNVYIDRIYFNDSPTGVDDVNYKNNGVAVAPNPTTGTSSVFIKGSGKPVNVKISVTDVTGKTVYSKQTTATGDAQFEIPAKAIDVKGVYMVQVMTDAASHVEKLVVY